MSFPDNEKIQHGKQTELEIELENFLKEQIKENGLTLDTVFEALETVKSDLELGEFA